MTRYSSRTAYLESMYKIEFIVILALVVTLMGVLFWTASIYRIHAEQPLRFVGVDPQTGETFALRPNAIRIDPGEAALRFSLKQFIELHDQRLAGRVDEDYAKSLGLMDRRLTTRAATGPALEEIKKVKQGAIEEQRVNVVNVVLREMRNDCKKEATPCRASVDFDRITLDRGTDSAKETRRVTAEIGFVLRPAPSISAWRENPLGLIITECREYSQ